MPYAQRPARVGAVWFDTESRIVEGVRGGVVALLSPASGVPGRGSLAPPPPARGRRGWHQGGQGGEQGSGGGCAARAGVQNQGVGNSGGRGGGAGASHGDVHPRRKPIAVRGSLVLPGCGCSLL